jgi:16S rRNA (cytosine1402-N4)-methyltransferase
MSFPLDLPFPSILFCIIFDFGFSSYHIEASGRGFSFLKDEPLDMRYRRDGDHKDDNGGRLTAERIVNTYSKDALEELLHTYGEERFARKIAQRIVERRVERPIKTTFELVEVIKGAVWSGSRRQRGIHPATRTFQALRIAVNQELENLRMGLQAAVPLLKEGGKIAIISFHSLEDRIVKNFFKAECAAGRLAAVTAKPVRPRSEEVAKNPRSRSARLRAAQKT